MFSEAEIIFNKINDDTNKGKKDLLIGYLYAAKNDCTLAKTFFDQALQKGQKCIPEEYKCDCKL